MSIMAHTLILNADAQPMGYVPLSTLKWQDAIKLMYQERVDVIAEYDDWEVSSVSLTLKVPAIMLMHEYKNVARGLKFNGKNIKLRDSYKCQYCNGDFSHDHSLLTQDHVIPRASGGKTNWTNIVAACMPCNLKKAHYDKMKPKTMPIKPSYYALVDKARQYPIVVPHASWIDYIGWEPDLVTVTGKHK